MASKQPVKTKFETVVNAYSEAHQHPTNKFIQWFCIPILTFGLLGVIWSIPFPHLAFLGKYNGFINWASFLIAFSIYYYLKVSPVISYAILLITFAFSAAIVSLEKMHTNQDWPTMGNVCLGIFILGLVLQFIGYTAEGKQPTFLQSLKNLLNAPLWLMHMLFVKLNIKAR